MTGRKPNLSNMRTFGSECFAYKQKRSKLDDRCTKGIFLGYDKSSPSYLVFIPETNKVMKYRVVKFPTKRMTEQQTQTEDVFSDFEEAIFCQHQAIKDPNPSTARATNVDEFQGVFNPETERATNEITEPIDNQVPSQSRYPRRERRPPIRLGDYVNEDEIESNQLMNTIDYCYRVSAFPQTYQEAMQSPDSENWKVAMNEEMNSLLANGTFSLSTLPQGRTPVGGRWVYTIKEGADGDITYKARFVAKGYSQVKGIDFEETFAPTANIVSVRVLCQLAAQYDLILHQMDVKTAYLNAPIDCEIYMEQAEGFETPNSDENERLVYKLNKSLYGLKQSGRNWNMLLHKCLIENNFTQSSVDHCVYRKEVGEKKVFVLIWVDDIILAASDNELMNETKMMLQERFKMKDLGKLSYFLGIEFEQGDGFVKMSQKRYLSKVLERFHMSNCKPRNTPSEQKLEFSDDSKCDAKLYRESVGYLIYAMTCTRPDLCWVVTKLSQNLSNPQKSHWTAVKHVLRYLKGTLEYELCYRKCKDNLTLKGYSNADWADSSDRRSTSGYCFSLNNIGPPISWKSKKQSTVALSSCEAEYIALALAVQESFYLTQLLKDLKEACQSATIFEDNQGTIALSKNPVNRQRAKHIDIRYHFIRSAQETGKVTIKYCPTQDMIADLMTKAATRDNLQKFKHYIFG